MALRTAKLAGLRTLSALMVLGLTSPLYAQRGIAGITDFSGEWIDNSFEGDDRGGPRTAGPSRANGLQPDAWLGNYLGIPYNDAGQQKAAAFDLSIYSHPAWMFRPHPVQYSMRGVIAQWRMSKEINPLNGRLVAYRITSGYTLDRVIWMDGRGHPPDYAEHSYQGFSTGRFERGMLVVTTTHMKHGYHRRNGAPASDQTTITEHFIRHGDRLTIVQFTEDPVYFEEPYVRTGDHILARDRHSAISFIGPTAAGWGAAEEVIWDEGYLPHYPLGTRHSQLAEWLGIPYEATQGGSETLYPEYREKLKQLTSESGTITPGGGR